MKNLTLRYSVTQFTFWAASSGAASFAAAYLLNKGISSGMVGILLGAAGVLSCLTQPFLASAVDHSRKFILTKMLILMSVICAVCFTVQLIPQVPLLAAGVCYMVGIWSSDAMIPFLNALHVSYSRANFKMNYGAARGIGSAATAISSLVLGHVIAQLGTGWMILLLLIFRIANILVLCGYPQIEKISGDISVDESCSVSSFFFKYRWYCCSLLGVLLLGMYHAMTENYLIAIMGRFGGNSGHVGTALFISAMAAFPVIFCFDTIRKYLRDHLLLKIAAVSFLAKAVLFFFASNITTIYCLQIIQMTSYAFLAPAQVFYAEAKVRRSDMVKGQAFITAAYALGCSAGNFAGGQLLGLGVKAILTAGIIMAFIGTMIVFLTVKKEDF